MVPPTWTVQSHFRGIRDHGQPYSLRGLALSSDELSLYTGFIGSHPGACIRQISSAIIPNEITVGSPDIAGLVEQLDQHQPKGISTDDRGNVFATLNPFGPAPILEFGIYSHDLTARVALVPSSTVPDSSELGGISVLKLAGNYYAYLARRGALATIERWNVNNTAHSALDRAWANGGRVDLKTVNANAFCNGIEVDADGTTFVAGGVRSNSKGDRVFKISPDGLTITDVGVEGAMDVALFGTHVFVTQYLGSQSRIVVLNKSDLACVATLATGIPHPNHDADSGYSGIAINRHGQIFVADQIYNVTAPSRTSFDRILISSAIAV